MTGSNWERKGKERKEVTVGRPVLVAPILAAPKASCVKLAMTTQSNH